MLTSSWLRNWKRPRAGAPVHTNVPSPTCQLRPAAGSDRRSLPVVDGHRANQPRVRRHPVHPRPGSGPEPGQSLGAAASATGEWWLANEGTGTSTLYNTSTSPVTVDSLVVSIPPRVNGLCARYADRYRL